jgi:hypothetical protein
MMKKFLCGIACVLFIHHHTQAQQVYVSPSGADNSQGTKARPLQTVQAAIAQADKLAQSGKFKSVQVWMEAGTYFIDSTIEVVQGKNWHTTVPLTIAGRAGAAVVIHGGRIVPPSALQPVSNASFTQHLPPSVRPQLRQVNLAELGITDLGKLRPVGFSRPFGPAWMEAFFNGKPGRLARWPNDSSVRIARLIDSGAIARYGDYSLRGGRFTYEGTDRPSRWQSPGEVWIAGYFMWGYADDAVPLKSIDTLQKEIATALPTMYGFGTGKPWRAWYAYNVPEEIDRVGEYYLNPRNQTLYFLPPDSLRSLELSVLETPMVALEGVKDVVIDNIRFTCSRGMGIYMERTNGVRVRNCDFSNLGMMAVNMGKGTVAENDHRHGGTGTPTSRVIGTLIQHVYDNNTFDREAGFNNGVENCVIRQTGAGGIFLTGGNRVTLEPGRSFVRNCIISDYNRLERSYRPGIWINGAGNHIANCEIFDAPASAIFLHGNDHIIEYNNLHHVAMEVDDMGALYYGRNPSERGNIVRYNYFHHIGGSHKTMAVYHDDGACGMQVHGNIFYKAATVAAFIGGGQDNTYTNNIFIEQPFAAHIDDRLTSWASAVLDSGGLFRQRLEAVNYQRPPYSTRYPELAGYFDNGPALPKRNVFTNNLLVKVKKRTEGKAALLPFAPENMEVDHDPGFMNYGKEDFRLRKDAAVWKQLPGFRQVPVEKIGYRPGKRSSAP